MDINFRAYHYRAMNAKTEEEKAEINNELKSLYQKLSEEEKSIFNEKLQAFLVSEYSKIKSMTEQINKEEER